MSPIETPSVSPWVTARTNDLHRGCVGALEHLAERLLRRQAHVLLLEGQPELLPQRPLIRSDAT